MQWLLLTLLCISSELLVAHGQVPETGRAAARRNVLLLISDDQGVDAAGCYGNPAIKTPNLDRLAQQGVRFTNAFATVASCSPSRSVIFSGLHNHTNGMYGLAHNEHKQTSYASLQSLPRVLSANGYRTGLIGKYHVAPREAYPFDTLVSEGDPFEIALAGNVAVRPRQETAAAVDIQGNRGGAQMAALARDFMKADNSRPFFLVVAYSDPHRAPVGFGNEAAYRSIAKNSYRPEAVRVPAFLPDKPEVRQELAEYYEAVSRLDQSIGLALKALEESGKQNETLVVYLSDNGIPFPGAKTNLYDTGIHLPLIVRSPLQKRAGITNNAMVSWIDIAPTIYDWISVQPHSKLPGRSFLPVLEQSDAEGWDTVYASHTLHEITMYYPMRAVRTRTHKLIWNLSHETPYPHAKDLWESPTWQGILRRGDMMMGGRSVVSYTQRPEYELYDLTKDPNEFKNVAAEPAYRQVFVDLQAKLRKMMKETNDPWTIKFEREQSQLGTQPR